MSVTIPQLICIFNDGFTSDQDPTVLKKYTLVRLSRGPDNLVDVTIERPASVEWLTLYPNPLGGHTFAVEPICIPFRMGPNTEMWPTGDFVGRRPDERIPVMDIGNRMIRAALCADLMSAEGDTVIALRRRQNRQKESRDTHLFIRPSVTGRRRETPPQPPLHLPPSATTEAPPRFVLELVKAQAIKEGQACPITMTPIEEGKPVAITSCFHLFEPAAIEQWRDRNDTCPVCKKKITSVTNI